MAATSTPRSSLTTSPPPSDELCAVAVHQPRTHGHADLRPQLEPQALVGFETARAEDEPLLPAIVEVRDLERAPVVATAAVVGLGLRHRQSDAPPERRLLVDRLGVQIQLGDAARPGVVESGVDGSVEPAPEARAIGRMTVTCAICSVTAPAGLVTAIMRGSAGPSWPRKRRPSVVTTSTSWPPRPRPACPTPGTACRHRRC